MQKLTSTNIENPLTDLLNSIFDNLYSSDKLLKIKHLHGSLKSLFVTSIINKKNKPVIIFCQNKLEAEDYFHDLSGLHDAVDISFLINPQKQGGTISFDDELSYWLIDGLLTILNSQRPIIITTPDILNIQLPAPSNVLSQKIKLTKDQEISFEQFTTNLMLNGFDRKDFVSTQGDIAIRGGIVDIFPINKPNPLRIEFIGDTIETIRTFDVISQRSIENHETIELTGKIYHAEDEQQFSENIFEYLDDNFVIIFDVPNVNLISSLTGYVAHNQVIEINTFGESDKIIKSTSQPHTNKTVKGLIESLKELADKNYKIHITAEGKNNLDRLHEIVDNNINYLQNDSVQNGVTYEYENIYINWNETSLSSGFISETLKIALFTEHEIFGRNRIQDNRLGKRRKGGLTLKELKQLNVGDLVVHVDKGIGSFDGLETIQIGGKYHESVRLIFADNDKLYVHLNYIHKIQKFTAEEGVVPKLSKLGTGDWQRKKDRTKKRLKDIARELIQLYAQRKASKGFVFPLDTMWQKEFEASFIYEDTPDQIKTNTEVKSDMQSPTPMDRLICGDVGYGKTEIAIRAAFKAVQANKQVAVLVPTTILAQQHYLTFQDRFENYPVNVDVLSRFRSSKDQKTILQRTEEGKIDILIGTHRILSKDVKFKDIGLLIIDEEHRFGVSAKEKLKNIKTNIDTLTLTATPIPRTLNYSLMGARDLSVIETPPRNRLPIETEITEWTDEYIQKIIYNEVKRSGQVFFVSDKVDDLELIQFDLKKLLPEIRFGIAHGQMTSTALENSMKNFIEKKFDVLISTKIVESGLDIPNSNTIIINRAQNFGLAELYQLRGRVGRSNTQAYCYLIIPPAKLLSNQALKRLQAIEEFSDLGSGFQLSMRDLEIRGAGNLLGPEQSGYINEIGFELYNKILDDAVKEIKHKEFGYLFEEKDDISYLVNDELQIETDYDALFPTNYINSDKERFYYYKRLYNLRNFEELSALIDEIEDKFGKAPKEAEELFFAVKVRIASLGTGITKISINKNNLQIEFPPQSNQKFYDKIFQEIVDFISLIPNALMKQISKKLICEIEMEKRQNAIDILWRLKKTVQVITHE